MKNRTKRVAASAFALLVAFVSACTTAEVELTVDAPQIATSESRTAVVDLVAVDVIEGAASVMVVPNLCLPYDPAVDAASGMREIYRLPLVHEIHAGLTRVSGNVPPKIELDLAERHTVSEDDTVYTFSLRKGLKFSDGSSLSSSDVKWSWERALRMSTEWGAAREVLGNIRGASDVLADGERIREIRNETRLNPSGPESVEPEASLTGIRVIDALNFEVHLVNPDPMFLDMLAHPMTFVLKDSNVEEWVITWRNDVYPGVVFVDEDHSPGRQVPAEALPIGAGPFKLIKYNPTAERERCVIARNDLYWDGAPEIEGVIYMSPGAPFGRTVESAFISGHIDYVLPPFEYIGKGLTDGAVIVTSQRPPFTRFMAMNPNFPPFDNVELRRALLASNDLTEVYPSPIEIGWPNTIVPHRLVPEYSHCERSPYVSTVDGYFGQKGLEDHTIEFWRLDDDYLLDRVRTLLNQWRRVSGLQYKVQDLEVGFSMETLMAEGTLQLRTVEVSPSIPSIAPVFQSMVGFFGGEETHREWVEVETMIADALQESDNARRFESFRSIECHLYDRALVLPMLVDWKDFEINTQPWVAGFELPTFGTSAFKDVRLDDSLPERSIPW